MIFTGALFISELKDVYITKNTDGCGTKARVAQLMDKHDTLAFDLLAMVCDDCVCAGAEPIAATNSLDMRSVSVEVVTALAKGLVDACAAAGVAMVGGETAELGDMVHGGDHAYIWNEARKVIKKEGRIGV